MNEKTDHVIVQSEDPEPYLCGNEREPYTRLMMYDGSLATVLTWRPIGSIEGDNLGWRFITTEGRTVAVRPVQLLSNARPFCVPAEINSSLRATSWLILLAHGKCRVNGEPEEPDYPAINTAVRKKTDHTARNEWYGKRTDLQEQAKTVDPAPWKDAFNRKLAEEAAVFWPEIFAKAEDKKKNEFAEKYIASILPEEYEKRLRIHIRDDLFSNREKQHSGLLARVKNETEKENQAAEAALNASRTEYKRECKRFFREIALYEINAFIGRTTSKKPVAILEPRRGGGYTAEQRAAIVKRLTDPRNSGAAKLEAILAFILANCEPGGRFGAADLCRLVRFMGEQVGKDVTLPVLLAYNSAMPKMFKGWVAETAKARKIKPAAAERFLAEHITFIAECEGRRYRHCYPVEDMTDGEVIDQEDRAPYQIPIHDEGTNLLTGEHATYTPNTRLSKGKGRPPATSEERKRDEKIAAEWKASGERYVSAFAEKKQLSSREVIRAINSHKHRLRSKQLVVVKTH
ncbi:MAG: hypothetical protein PHR77_13605 [Kiritimatiellae bacterium]|nr:hypothetical protein [Kiritimatiellia bacterium]MDD5520740.1 hypothetical protein [Kiritimatiellia bacterium]